ELTDEYLREQVMPNELSIRDFDPLVEASADRWARGKINQLRDEMTPEELASAESQVSQRLAKLVEETPEDRQRLARLIQRFPRFAASTEARLRLAKLYFAAGQVLPAETLVRPLLTSDLPPEQVGPLVSQLAQGLADAGLPREAAKWYRHL